MKISLKYFVIVLIATFFVSVLGATLAYFAATQSSDDGDITGNAAMVHLNLGVSKLLPQNAGVIVPQLSGSALEVAIRNGCVDSNNNDVCQVYKIVVTNGSSASVVVDGNIAFFGDDNFSVNLSDVVPNMKWMVISSYNESNYSTTTLGNGSVNNADSTKRNIVSNLTIGPNGTYTYYVVVWLNETGDVQGGQNQVFRGEVSFDSTNGNGVTATFS